MKTVVIKESFDGYPQGAKEGARKVSYVEGQEVEVSGDLIIGKGLARETAASRAESKADPAEAGEKKDQDA
ncbi:hypothetical protein LOK46_13490 [Methylobacterium sp. NMS14P]|uniref:hypothetical protein n=1 Tax=Methylobacterium sp. NMS14P TaxID=2894310 RepID=UPI002359FFAB|nr:hypothetical protein [Methylobacterium sp. NMS14P]WCS27788.1 hypothetical protein LOK46_13490 [Methylobacterium sp. NMS14P]